MVLASIRASMKRLGDAVADVPDDSHRCLVHLTLATLGNVSSGFLEVGPGHDESRLGQQSCVSQFPGQFAMPTGGDSRGKQGRQ
jgi:hypothetical protein